MRDLLMQTADESLVVASDDRDNPFHLGGVRLEAVIWQSAS